MTGWSSSIVAELEAALRAVADPAKAAPMAAYLRHQFPFLGIPTPARTAVVKAVLAGRSSPSEADLLAAAGELWELAEREYQYAACDLFDRWSRSLTPLALDPLRHFIVTKAWWDTVDALRKPVGVLVFGQRRLVSEMRAWNASDDRWLVRSSIILQLGWKRNTDEALLFELCANRATDPEFFVRKAIGWALREYAKVAPDAVRRFVAEHPELSPLSRREALRRIDAAREDG